MSGITPPRNWRETERATAKGYLDRLAERLADSVREEYRLQAPIRRERWCRLAGVTIEWTEMIEEGQYRRSPVAAIIQLRRSWHQTRLNFTLAHELGHHFLEQSRREPELRRRLGESTVRHLSRVPIGGDDEEQLCNAFAAALLMPASIAQQASRAELRLEAIQTLARCYGMSLSATVVRLQRAGNAPIDYLLCKPTGFGGWLPRPLTGHDYRYTGSMRLDLDPDCVLPGIVEAELTGSMPMQLTIDAAMKNRYLHALVLGSKPRRPSIE